MLMKKCLGPYLIEKCHDSGVVQIRTIDEEHIPLLVNGCKLKIYRKPLSSVEFIDSIRKELKVIENIRAPNPFNP